MNKEELQQLKKLRDKKKAEEIEKKMRKYYNPLFPPNKHLNLNINKHPEWDTKRHPEWDPTIKFSKGGKLKRCLN